MGELTAWNSAAKSGGPHYFRVVTNETLEVLILGVLWFLVFFLEDGLDNKRAAWTFRDVVLLATSSTVVRRLYNAHLERAFDASPELRTQPAKKRSEERDVTGRTKYEVALIEYHDRLTMLGKFSMDFFFYAVIGHVLYPVVVVVKNVGVDDDFKADFDLDSQKKWSFFSPPPVMLLLLPRLLAHHYVLSFGMYWMHRLLHVNTFLWEHVHSYHHYAKTPLARATYMDHWLDNLANALIAEVGTQILVPLPKGLLFFSRLFRVMESLEKHSGLSGPVNVAHTAQRFLPFAQMPHHHDWHHEGFKGSNYTFASLGGIWDVLFGTRHPGRSNKSASNAATPRDDRQHATGGAKPKNTIGAFFDLPAVCPLPTILFATAVTAKLLQNF